MIDSFVYDTCVRNMREIALDTETTGLNWKNGDRIIEIGCVEIIDKSITNNKYHTYINPERNLSHETERITGLSYDFLKDYPSFGKVYTDFLDFVKNDRLIIHNAKFDLGFLNYELQLLNMPQLPNEVLDTLSMAREKYPGSPATLDALCKKFNVNSSTRIKHGALIDAGLLAEVYTNMSVEKVQMCLFQNIGIKKDITQHGLKKENRAMKLVSITQEEEDLHIAFLKKIPNNLWNIN